MAKKKVGLIRPCYLELKRLSSKNGNFFTKPGMPRGTKKTYEIKQVL